MNARIQLVEDDQGLAQILSMHFAEAGHDVRHASTIADARRQIEENQPDLILLDHGLPDGKGYDFLGELLDGAGGAVVIMITSEHDLDLAIAAIQRGAFDFIHKPVKTEELDHAVARALQHLTLSRQVQALSALPEHTDVRPRLLGQSSAMLSVSKDIALVADSQTRVLVCGESGTGKELVARAIHQHGQRPGPFLAINCAALVDELLESELFGHEKGAFTGATARKAGKFELASDGTLFLDEIGELALPLQAKLLRVLQEGTFERVGGTQPLHSNARVIAATNRDLASEVEQGNFREDLFYRLTTMQIRIPPLRDRREDIPMLVEGLVARICRREGRPIMAVAAPAMAMLTHYDWPGNVRELENVLSQAVLRNRGTAIDCQHIVISGDSLTSLSPGAAPSAGADTPRTLAEVEAAHVQYVLDYAAGHKGRACELLNISRPALDRKIAKYGLSVK